jgi:hypothetical protein
MTDDGQVFRVSKQFDCTPSEGVTNIMDGLGLLPSKLDP